MARNEKETLLKAEHVKVYFQGKNKKEGVVRAVDDVSLDIHKGETFGVVGESGCGKSTLGRTLIRLIDPTEGHIYLSGEDISEMKGKKLKDMRRKMQIIFQDPSACLNPRRTVRQILMENPPQPFTARTITDPYKVLDELARIRQQGYAVCDGDYDLDTVTFGAPLLDNTGNAWAALVMSAPRSRVDDVVRERYLFQVRETANQISRELGFAS